MVSSADQTPLLKSIIFPGTPTRPALGIKYPVPTFPVILTVDKAVIDQGSLQLEGTSTRGSAIKLDNTYSASIVQSKFKFALRDYHPGDCVITLKANVGLAPAVNAVVANCGMPGLSPRGAWLNGNSYVTDDVVVLDGSSWRAKKAGLLVQSRGWTAATIGNGS